MNWHEVEKREGREWEREDGYAVVRVRETAAGEWAVTYDRLEQAPEGSDYERVTVESEAEALDRAASFRGSADRED